MDAFLFETICNSWLYAINLRANGARRVFPCWDEPSLKSTFNITIKCPKNYIAFSNMHLVSNDIDEDGIWMRFETTTSISAYLITFLIYDSHSFTSSFLSTKNAIVWYRNHTNIQHMRFAQLVANRVVSDLHDMAKLLNVSWKLPNLDSQDRIMENSKLVIYK